MPRRRVTVGGSYTRIGELTRWEAWGAMGLAARSLWLGLYASPESRLLAPGLWRGGNAVLAEAASLGIGDTMDALSELKDRGLVLVDKTQRVIVLTRLPDRGQRPANGSCVTRFFCRWQEVPECEATDLWVHLFLWLCQPLTRDHEEAWNRTFGEATGIYADTEPVYPLVPLDIAPELPFVSHPTNPNVGSLTNPNVRSHTKPSTAECVELSSRSQPKPARCDTVSDTVSDTPLYTDTVSVSGKKGGQGGRTRGPAKGKKRPWGVKELLGALKETSAGRVATEPWDQRMAKPLWAVIDACILSEVTLEDVRLAGEWLAAGGLAYRDDLGIPWVVKRGELLNAVAKARTWNKAGRPSIESRKSGGGKPGRLTAADLAKRAALLEAQGQ